jgi:uncharacterized repeat protein (TIGR02543 family)
MKKIKYLFMLFGVFFLIILASCNKEICTVTFVTEHGDFIKTVEIYAGEKVTEPESVKEYDGYVFDNWYLNDEIFSFDTKIENNIKLIAKYTTNKYLLQFGYGIAPIEVEYGKPIGQIPSVPNVEGKEYGVWTLDGVILTSTTIYEYAEDKEAALSFIDKMVTVSFVSEEELTKVISYGSTVFEPREPQKEGYEFAGWYYGEEKFDFETKIKEDITLTAHWKPSKDTKYTVNVYLETEEGYKDVTKDYSSVLSNLTGTTDEVVNITEIATSITPANYMLNTSESVLQGNVLSDGSLELTIYYNLARYTVSFDAEGVSAQSVMLGSTATRPNAPTKDGYVFYTWLLGENEYDFNQEVTKDINLTAQWIAFKDHAITFDSLIGVDVKAQSLSNGEKVQPIAELEKIGYSFEGWYYGNQKWDFNTALSSTHDKNINLVAKWVACEYELTFDEAGNNTIKVTYDQPIGNLPVLKDLSDNKTGNWSIDGEEITSDTVWKYLSDKEANSQYYTDMTSQTIDLSTKGEDDLSAQLLKHFNLTDVNVSVETEDGVEISKSYLDELEATATDEASRTKTIVAKVGNTEYKLNVFFATKVIRTYEELTKIQEYGGVKTSKFPADFTYTMYGYTGYFILGNDIDASPSMTKTYKVGTMGRFDSQTWDTEMEGFRGVFDGRGYTIDNLHTGNSGLLGDVLEGAVIKNLSMTNAKIVEGKTGGGILCYIFSRATAENIYIDFTTSVNNSGIFGRMNKAGTIRNVVIKYNNAGVSGGVLSSWQVNTKYIPFPIFENVSFIYEKGTNASMMKSVGNSIDILKDLKEKKYKGQKS